jgi:hypothetical protein
MVALLVLQQYLQRAVAVAVIQVAQAILAVRVVVLDMVTLTLLAVQELLFKVSQVEVM